MLNMTNGQLPWYRQWEKVIPLGFAAYEGGAVAAKLIDDSVAFEYVWIPPIVGAAVGAAYAGARWYCERIKRIR